MANATTMNAYRQRLANHLATGSPLPPFGFIAFGDGGHTPDLKPQSIDPNATALNHELLRKPIHAITRPTPYVVECEGRLEPDELVGIYVSEAALFDTAGNIVAMKTFSPKIHDADELYQVFISPRF